MRPTPGTPDTGSHVCSKRDLSVAGCIHRSPSPRTRGVGQLERKQVHWVIEPLLEAGLTVDQVEVLVLRLGFEAVVGEGRGTVASVQTVVAAESAEVQAAWAVTVGRMIELGDPA